MNYGISSRVFAGCIAAAAWIGLVIQFVLNCQTYSVWRSVWLMLAYFTITTNLLVAAVFTCVAIDRTVLRSDWIVAGTTLSIAVGGVIYALLLWGTMELSGGSAIVDKLLHVVTPVLALLFWVFVAHKGRVKWNHPLLWAIYPLSYFVYGMVRGLATGRFAYPFLDVLTLGWQRTAFNAFAIIAAFILSGYAVVWIGRRISSSHLP